MGGRGVTRPSGVVFKRAKKKERIREVGEKLGKSYSRGRIGPVVKRGCQKKKNITEGGRAKRQLQEPGTYSPRKEEKEKDVLWFGRGVGFKKPTSEFQTVWSA